MLLYYIRNTAGFSDKLVLFLAIISYTAFRLLTRLRWGKVNRDNIMKEKRISLATFMLSDITTIIDGCKYYFQKKQKMFFVESEVNIHGLIKGILQPGDTFVDIGSNMGQYSLPIAKRVGSKGRVIAADANPENIMNLRKNIEINNLGNVTALHLAVSDHDGQSTFYLTGESGTGSLLQRGDAAQPIQIQSITLDSLVKSLNVDDVDLLKIDVEGSEIECIRGGRLALKNTRHVIIECHSTQNRKLAEEILEADFTIKEVDYLQEFDTSHILCTRKQ